MFFLHFCRLSHEIIFQAVWNLLSILRTGDREAYRQFFLDAMVAVEGMHSVLFILFCSYRHCRNMISYVMLKGLKLDHVQSNRRAICGIIA
jgi:hypothetical protein